MEAERRHGEAVARRPTMAILYYKSCFFEVRSGPQQRTLDLFKFLSAHYDRVKIFTLNASQPVWSSDTILAMTTAYPNATLEFMNYGTLDLITTKLKNTLVSLFPQFASRICAYSFTGNHTPLREALQKHPDAHLYISYVDGLTQLQGLKHGKIIIETHDLKFVNQNKKSAKPSFGLKSLLRMRAEVALLDTAAAVVAISPVEESFIRLMTSNTKVVYVPTYSAYELPSRQTQNTRYDLLFVGSAHELNVSGLLNFCNDNKWAQKYSIAVCGDICSDSRIVELANNSANIELLGFVDEIASIYEQSKCSIAPVDGTGLKIKILQSLAYGTPVFASREAISGLMPGYQDCVFPISQGKIEQFLHDQPFANDASEEARRYIGKINDCPDRDLLLYI